MRHVRRNLWVNGRACSALQVQAHTVQRAARLTTHASTWFLKHGDRAA